MQAVQRNQCESREAHDPPTSYERFVWTPLLEALQTDRHIEWQSHSGSTFGFGNDYAQQWQGIITVGQILYSFTYQELRISGKAYTQHVLHNANLTLETSPSRGVVEATPPEIRFTNHKSGCLYILSREPSTEALFAQWLTTLDGIATVLCNNRSHSLARAA